MEQPSPVPPPAVSKEERNWAMLAHLSALLTYVTVIGGVIAPLVIWLMRKQEGGFAAEQARESLNFQITVFLIGLGCWVLALILIGFVLLAILGIVNLVLVIIAAIKVSEGVAYRYPFNLRLVS